MAFKSEIHVAELASIRTGHTEGDIYYILDNGMLGDLPCKPGTFVKWHNDAWQIQPDEHYALASAADGEIAQAIDNILDDGSASETIVVAVPSSQSGDYVVGNYYEVQGEVARLRTKTEGDNVTQLTFDTTSGLLEAINNSGKISVFYVTYPSAVKTYPDPDEILAAIDAGKFVVIDEPNQGVWEHTLWLLQRANRGPQDHIYFEWKDRILVAERDNTAETPVWTWFKKDIGFAKTESVAPEYADLTFPVAAGTACMHDGLLYVANTTISTAEAWTSAHWTQKSVEDEIDDVKSKIGSVKNGGALTSAASVDVPNNACSALSASEATLTLNVNVDVNEIPNFAVEITAGANITLTVTKTVGGTTMTLNYAAAAGNTLESGKLYQVTCVGSCWTLAEFTVPTP